MVPLARTPSHPHALTPSIVVLHRAAGAVLGAAALAVVAIAVVLLAAALVRMAGILTVVAPPGRQPVHQAVELVPVRLTTCQPSAVQMELLLPHGIPHTAPALDLLLLLKGRGAHALDTLGQVIPAATQLLANARWVGAVVLGAGTNGLDGLIVLQAHAPSQRHAGALVVHALLRRLTLLCCLVAQASVLAGVAVGAGWECPVLTWGLIHILILLHKLLLIQRVAKLTVGQNGSHV